MIGAIVRNNIVDNVIVLNESQISELSLALNCEIIDARPYGLSIGDLRTDRGWTRNAGGEQIALPLLDQENYDSYTKAMQQVAKVEEEKEIIAEEVSSEIFAILSGDLE